MGRFLLLTNNALKIKITTALKNFNKEEVSMSSVSPKYAIVRELGRTTNRGLRIFDRGEVDVPLAKRQHSDFCDALVKIGYKIVVTMPANDDLPDSVFVEDPAVILGDVLVITRLARLERKGEEDELEKALESYFTYRYRIKDPGLVEGGDVLVTDDTLYIGLSNRTNAVGAKLLSDIGSLLHYKTKMIQLPNDRLHLKGEVAYHPDTDTITVTPRLAPEFCNAKQRIIAIPVDDDLQRFGANCISKGNMMITTSECPAAERILYAYGYKVLPVDLTEINRIDGAMTCLCKVW